MKLRHRATGLQVAQVALAVQLDAWRDQLGADDYAVLIELHGRRLDRERAALARSGAQPVETEQEEALAA